MTEHTLFFLWSVLANKRQRITKAETKAWVRWTMTGSHQSFLMMLPPPHLPSPISSFFLGGWNSDRSANHVRSTIVHVPADGLSFSKKHTHTHTQGKELYFFHDVHQFQMEVLLDLLLRPVPACWHVCCFKSRTFKGLARIPSAPHWLIITFDLYGW